MRTLSRGNLILALVGPFVLVVIVGIAEIVNEDIFTVQGFNVGLILFGIFMVWAWGAASTTCDVLYDPEFFYLKGILGHSRIPLANVTNIYLSNSSKTEDGRIYLHYIVRFNHSSIAYRSIKQRKGSDKMKMFVAAVRKVNAKVVVENQL